MTKKIFSAAVLMFTLIVTSCGPAAEDRQAMHRNAKVFQDSLANMIRTSMAEAEAPANVMVAPAPTPTAAQTATTK